MKKLLFSLLAFCFCGTAAMFADENVRAVQTRLKQDGFYFGEATGTYDSETAAAVSRFQIRNGLQISGQLDEATAKALGMAAGATVATPTAAAPTWQRLRKTDREFLARQHSRQAAQPRKGGKRGAAGRDAAAATTAAAPLQPDEANGATVVLSRERLRDYVAAFVLAGLDTNIGAELEFFADQVNYYDQGTVGREKIRGDLASYSQQWPQRRFWLAGEVDVQPQADSRIRVTFPLRYNLRNGRKQSSGRVIKTLLLEVTGEDLQIVSVNERKARG